VKPSIRRASDALLGGGVIAYPTDGIYGLGCMPDDPDAIVALLAIKKRSLGKGLILIGADRAQFEGWVDDRDLAKLPEPDPLAPITWIAKPGPTSSELVMGEHRGIAVRLTVNPVARAICRAVESPITSTSANLSGRPAARNRYILRRQFGSLVDYVVPGDCGPATAPSSIRVLDNGKTLRP
jgi:L-threonylcarbamoyladenylate synthase